MEKSPLKICATCGTRYPQNFTKKECVICLDDRQYIPEEGQEWTDSEKLHKEYCVKIGKVKENLYEFVSSPGFAIGQRALLVLSDKGNMLWDCMSVLDGPTIDFIAGKGGIAAIAISHPHYYGNMQKWAAVFDCPIHLHKKDEKWIMEPSEKVRLWEGTEKTLWDGIKIINIGGHFPGSTILLVPQLSPKGTVLCGDTFFLSPSMEHFAVMYSYPNNIPLAISEIRKIKERMETVEFDSVHGFAGYQNLTGNAKRILIRSLDRYK